jgi:hypothetical protein
LRFMAYNLNSLLTSDQEFIPNKLQWIILLEIKTHVR